MNRTLKYALGAVLTTAMVLPAFAQDNFPDVPDNHWAYEALKNMKKDGLLVGYPDGLFRGGRPASRYELAVAVHATYQRLKGITDGLDAQIKALSASLDGKADKADLQALRDALATLQNDVNGMKPWGDDIANLKKLASTFEKEIASLGVDVEAMKKDLGDLKDRVTALEKRKPAIDIHGTFDLVGLGGYGTSSRYGMTVDGRPTGVGRGSYSSVPVGITRDLSIYHEGAFVLSTTNDEGPKAHATLVVGNMLGTGSGSESAFGDQSNTLRGGFIEGDENVYFQDFAVTFDTSVLGQSFNAEVGRTGYKISPYIFQRPDTTPYFANDRWDNGKWMFDGAILGFKLGPAKLDVFGGRKSADNASGYNGDQIQPMSIGRNGSPFVLSNIAGSRPWGLNGGDGSLAMPIDQMLGLHLSTPITDKAQLNLAYLWLDSNTVGTLPLLSTPYNRVSVYGGDLKVNLNPLEIAGGYAATDLQYDTHNVISKENYAWWGSAAFKAEKWGLEGGYKEIHSNFAAPGDWGRIGTWWNPTDIKGYWVGGNADLSENLTLKAKGEWYTGINDSYDAVSSLTSDDKVDRYSVDLGYKLNTSWGLNLGWEYVQYNLASRLLTFTGGKPQEQWYNIGLNYGFSSNAKLSVLWQISDYDAKGVIPFQLSGPDLNRATGGLLTTQLTVKF
jgi:hypothetical protein